MRGAVDSARREAEARAEARLEEERGDLRQKVSDLGARHSASEAEREDAIVASRQVEESLRGELQAARHSATEA